MELARKLLLAILLIGLVSSFSPVASQDTVYVKSGGKSRKNGKITRMNPESVSLQSGSRTEEISSGNIAKIVYGGEPKALGRARDRFEDGRFDDCISELNKIDGSSLSPLVKQEIAYLESFSNAEISLRGGDVSAQVAGKKINDFIRAYGQSYRLHPGRLFLGQLFLAVGRMDLSEKEFAKLSGASWPEFKIQGLFHLGRVQLLANNPQGAVDSLAQVGSVESSDDASSEYKLLAECLSAKAAALSGNVDAGRKKIEAIIKREDPMTAQRAFAYAYNALGACHQQNKNWLEAATAYLHTELLFATDPEAHAEALYQLSKIWAELEETDRANKARATLRSRYRNSYWSKKP